MSRRVALFLPKEQTMFLLIMAERLPIHVLSGCLKAAKDGEQSHLGMQDLLRLFKLDTPTPDGLLFWDRAVGSKSRVRTLRVLLPMMRFKTEIESLSDRLRDKTAKPAEEMFAQRLFILCVAEEIRENGSCEFGVRICKKLISDRPDIVRRAIEEVKNTEGWLSKQEFQNDFTNN